MAPKKIAKKSRKPAAKKKAAKKPAKARKAPAKARKPAAPKAAKKPAKRKAKAPEAQPHELPWRVPLAGETKIGVVDDFFGHISVIALVLEKPLAAGDRIHVHGHTTDLTQNVESLQIGHEAVQSAVAGAAVGIKVSDKCRKGDWVFRVAAV